MNLFKKALQKFSKSKTNDSDKPVDAETSVPEASAETSDVATLQNANNTNEQQESTAKTAKEKKREKKQLKKQEQAEKKKTKAAKQKAKPKKAAKKPGKPKKVKEKKPKPTKEEKLQKKDEQARRKKELLLQKTKRKADKIRARGKILNEKIRVKKERKAGKKHSKKEQRAENKRFKKSIRDEIKMAKKDMPRNYFVIIGVPVVVVVLLASSVLFLHSRNIGPFGALNLPQPPAVLTSIKLPSISLPSVKLPFLSGNGSKASEKAVKNMFESFQALDFEKAGDYVDMSALIIPDGYLEIIDTASVMNATFDKLTFEIAEKPVKVSDTEYDVTVSVSAIKIKPVMAKFVSAALTFQIDNAISPTPLSASDLNKKTKELFSECVNAPDLATVTNTIAIKVLEADKDAWKVEPDQDFINALFGGVIVTAGKYWAPDPPEPAPASESNSESNGH